MEICSFENEDVFLYVELLSCGAHDYGIVTESHRVDYTNANHSSCSCVIYYQTFWRIPSYILCFIPNLRYTGSRFIHTGFTHTYACMILSPASEYDVIFCTTQLGTWSLGAVHRRLGGGFNSNHKNYFTPQWYNLPSHGTMGCLPLQIPVKNI